MFKKLFSGDKQNCEQQNKAATSPVKSQQQEIQYEKTLNNLNIQMENLDQQSEILETKLEKMDEEIRSLIQQKQTKKAKSKILQARGYKNQIEKLEVQKNVFSKMKINLEIAQTNLTSFDVIGEVNKFLKDHDKINDKLQESIEQYSDISQSMQEQDNMWKQLQDIAGQNRDEIDEELKRYEEEMELEQANDVVSDFHNIPSLKIQKQQSQKQSTKKINFEKEMNLLIN